MFHIPFHLYEGPEQQVMCRSSLICTVFPLILQIVDVFPTMIIEEEIIKKNLSLIWLGCENFSFPSLMV